MPICQRTTQHLACIGAKQGLTLARSEKICPQRYNGKKAARGTNGYVRPWGKGRAVWIKPRTTELITSVKSYPNDVSSFGVYDLAGNAREWCYDFYSVDSYDQALQSSNDVPRNWQGPKVASPRKSPCCKRKWPQLVLSGIEAINHNRNETRRLDFVACYALNPKTKMTKKMRIE